jgi:hypothetical protein
MGARAAMRDAPSTCARMKSAAAAFAHVARERSRLRADLMDTVLVRQLDPGRGRGRETHMGDVGRIDQGVSSQEVTRRAAIPTQGTARYQHGKCSSGGTRRCKPEDERHPGWE